MRDRILSDAELCAVWKAAETSKGPFGSLVQFILLTAARRTEAAGLVRAEISGPDWILPANRNKTKVEFVRPLSPAAQGVLAELPQIGEGRFVFTTDGERPISGFSKFKAAFDQVSGVTGWTLHDLRRTARSLLSRAGVDADVAERCLGHVLTGVRATYDRHEFYHEKRRAFEVLAVLIERIVEAQPATVLPLHVQPNEPVSVGERRSPYPGQVLELTGNEIAIVFRADQPLDSQLAQAKWILEGFQPEDFKLPRRGRRPYREYLQVLDATDLQVPSLGIATSLFPNIENEYPDYAGNQQVRNYLTAAIKLRDGGYRQLVGADNPVK
jgi:hypothetical protein